MRRIRALAIATVILTFAVPAQPDTPLPTVLQLLGTVTNAAAPVGNALVIALNLSDFAATQTYTSNDGRFTLPTLRAGVYKIIAVKQGFLPAITTVVPTRQNQKLALRLETDKGAARRKDVNQELWELRGSLPPDVLRELDFMLEPPSVAFAVPRFRGELQSLTGVASEAASSTAFAKTAVGVQGRLNDTWQLGIRGNLHRVEDPTDDASFGDTLAESSVMQMELRSSPTDAYRIATTKSTWRYNEPELGGREADVRAHNFEWTHGLSRVQVRYFEQENLFTGSPFASSNLIEVAGNAMVMQTRRSDLGVSLRVTQESAESNSDALRMADISANGTFSLVPALILHYGMTSRIGVDGQEWAPRTGAEWKITRGTSLVASGLYKVLDRDASTVTMPSIVFWSEDSRVLPTYAYSFGIVSGKDATNRLSAIATVSAIDSPQRVVFTDGYDNFWDGLYVDRGDVRRDLRVAYRREFGNWLAVDVSTTAGTATSRDLDVQERQKTYVIGDLQSTFTPTGTTLLVSYREIQQPRADGAGADYRSERLNLRMAQSLYLPIDVRLLLGLELARAENSPYLLDALTAEGTRKYIGGLAVNF